MAIDSRQKRMSAMNVGCPWRGPLVDAAEAGFTQGNRQAAAFMYSGIAAESPAPVSSIAYFQADTYVGTVHEIHDGGVHGGSGGFWRLMAPWDLVMARSVNV